MKKEEFFIQAARWTLAIALAAAVSTSARAQNAVHQVLQDPRPAAASHLSPTGRLAADTRLNLSIGLPLRNESALDTLLSQLSDPASPNFRHYLTHQQFIDQFAPSAADYQTAADYFGTNGFTVVQHPDRMVLDVSGSSANVERVFHLTMRTYQHPTKNRTFFAPDSVPSLNLNVPIVHISGLDNYAVKQPKMVKEKAVKRSTKAVGQVKTQDLTGSGPEQNYMGNDFRAAYMPGVSLNGAGQTVGLVEFDTYYPSDVAYYTNLNGLSVPIVTVPIDGGVSTQGAGNDEVSLDIDVAMSIAPALDNIVLYTGSTNLVWDDVFDTMANDTTYAPKQFSCSWGDDAPGSPDVTAENLFKQMAAQGQSFYNAEGDGDAFVGGIPFPEESTNIVQAGGTTLTTTGPGGPPFYETVWDWGGQTLGDSSVGSGGGESENFAIPSWQQGISMTANGGSTTMRNTPDVAMLADNIFIEGDDGYDYTVGGTSAAAPAWAAFTALANQQAAAHGKPSVGFADPLIYATCKSPAYSSYFNDITSGNNFWELSTTSFPAVPGYDLCTGWGTPVGDNLLDLLAGVGDPLGVAPGKGIVAFGPADGPFTANTLAFSLTNSSASSLNWSLINTSAWLTASSSGGALAAHTATHITVSLNTSAYSLPPGTYIGGVLFSNQTSHAARTRNFVLMAGQNLVQNGDFEDGLGAGESTDYPLPGWAQSGGIGFYDEQPYPTYNSDFVDDGTITSFAVGGGESTYSAYSGSLFFVFGTAGAIGYISENIATVPGQTYGLSFWFENVGGGSTTEFLVNWNADKIYDVLDAPDSSGWVNHTFYLTATSTNTVLQFGGRDDSSAGFLDLDASGFLGLDDVVLLQIPSLNPSVSKAGPNALALTWNSLAGQSYDVFYSTNLTSPNWLDLTNVTPAGQTFSLTNTITSSPKAFYRIAVP